MNPCFNVELICNVSVCEVTLPLNLVNPSANYMLIMLVFADIVVCQSPKSNSLTPHIRLML